MRATSAAIVGSPDLDPSGTGRRGPQSPSGFGAAETGRPGRSSGLRSLVYHRLGDPADTTTPLSPLLVTTTAQEFEWQLRHLVRGYTPISAKELTAAIQGRHALPPRAVLVTFDDGYRDFLEIAWPLLKAQRVPAILFVPTAFPDAPRQPFWWDRVWQAVARTTHKQVQVPGLPLQSLDGIAERLMVADVITDWLKGLAPARRAEVVCELEAGLGVIPDVTSAVLTWAELRRLQRDGATIAAHSRTHELLDQIGGGALKSEVAGSRNDLNRELGGSVPLFAYPNGNYSRETLWEVHQAGFQAGFTVVHGLSQLGQDHPLLLRRDQGGTTRARFALHLLGPVARVRALRNPLARSAEPHR